jgi:hypothetical protein
VVIFVCGWVNGTMVLWVGRWVRVRLGRSVGGWVCVWMCDGLVDGWVDRFVD